MQKTKLEILTERKKQLDIQIQALKAKESQQKRKDDTRKKILIGGVVMKMLKSGEMTDGKLREMLDKHLDSERDRVLFGLPVKEVATEIAKKTEKL
jgi:hypothetical protein